MSSHPFAFAFASVAAGAGLLGAGILAACSTETSPPAGGAPDATAPVPTVTKDAATPDVASDVAVPDDVATTPGAPAVRFVGRFADEGAGKRFAWTGSTIAARFRGTSVTLLLRDFAVNPHRNHFTLVVDKQAPTRLDVEPTRERYELATGLADGIHEVSITRDTEAFVGDDLFLGFEFGGGGALLEPPATPTRRIEVIGDSITCGYGVEGPNETCPFTSATENGTITYGPLAARALGADVTSICWSGKGVSRNGGGDTTDLMPTLFDRTIATRADSVWGFTGPAPDAVVVNLSTNDFATGVPVEQTFVTAYRAFLTKLRGRYPTAHLFGAVGPMHSDYYPQNAMALTNARRYVQSAVDGQRQAGDTRVHFVEFAVQDGTANGLGCDWHPSRKTQEIMAATLTAKLRTTLGW